MKQVKTKLDVEKLMFGPKVNKLQSELSDGSRNFFTVQVDLEMDPVRIDFDEYEEEVRFDCEDYNNLSFSPDQLRAIADMAEEAFCRREVWLETKAGRKWQESCK